MALEREVKFGVTPDFVLPDLDGAIAGLGARPESELELDAHYFDTPELALLRRGATLRRRTGEGAPTWTLKLPEGATAGGVLARREIDVIDRSAEPPAQLVELVRDVGFVGGDDGPMSLDPVARVQTLRRRVVLVDAVGRDLVEIADDQVTGRVVDEPPMAFREIEAELLPAGGDDESGAALLAQLSSLLQAAGASAPDPVSKLARVLAPLLARSEPVGGVDAAS